MTTVTDWSSNPEPHLEPTEAPIHGPATVASCVQIRRRETPLWKRTIDVGLVVVFAPLLAPLLLAVAVYVRMVSSGPVMFIQSRIGHGGEPFAIYKFRTMHVSSESRDETHRGFVASYAGDDGAMKKPDYKDQLIFGGDFLRKTSIDELPQLLNVLKGNMSLVGPRPDVMQLEDYEPGQLRRFEVLPGMTGLWQVSGKNRLSFEQMVELDLRYIDTQTLTRDLVILARTALVLVFERNE